MVPFFYCRMLTIQQEKQDVYKKTNQKSITSCPDGDGFLGLDGRFGARSAGD